MVSARRVVVAAVVVCLLATPAFAQVTTADIVGRVTDASGAVLPGVTVTVENLGTHDDARRADRARPATTRSTCCRSAATP